MPYIDRNKRDSFDGVPVACTVGELNYLLTQVCLKYYKGLEGYSAINDVIGALECAKQEFYRRAAIPYEEEKRKQNGDVY